MSQLREFQEQFQRAILGGERAVLEDISEGAHERREVLLDVYRKGYTLRLVKMLQAAHELLPAYLGTKKFDALARTYMDANPPRDPLTRHFADHLPQFLRETKPYSAHPEMAELALLEKSLNDAFYSADAPVLVLADLAGIPPETWADLQFEPHPSAVRLDLATNASAIWTALRNKKKPPAAKRRQTVEPILVWRQAETAVFRTLSAEEAVMWGQAANGARFAAMCETLAAGKAPDLSAATAATYLQSWISSGLLSSATTQNLSASTNANHLNRR